MSFRLSFNQRDFEQAGEYLRRALECSTTAGESIYRGGALMALGELHIAKEEWPRAIEALEAALPHWQRIRGADQIARIQKLLITCHDAMTTE